jgi:hypothetical protein
MNQATNRVVAGSCFGEVFSFLLAIGFLVVCRELSLAGLFIIVAESLGCASTLMPAVVPRNWSHGPRGRKHGKSSGKINRLNEIVGDVHVVEPQCGCRCWLVLALCLYCSLARLGHRRRNTTAADQQYNYLPDFISQRLPTVPHLRVENDRGESPLSVADYAFLASLAYRDVEGTGRSRRMVWTKWKTPPTGTILSKRGARATM